MAFTQRIRIETKDGRGEIDAYGRRAADLLESRKGGHVKSTDDATCSVLFEFDAEDEEAAGTIAEEIWREEVVDSDPSFEDVVVQFEDISVHRPPR